MKFQIKHEYGNRMRIHVCSYRMTCGQADILQYYLQKQGTVLYAKVYDRTGDAVIETRAAGMTLSGFLENSPMRTRSFLRLLKEIPEEA